jgi:hypothetical protein
LKPRFSPFIPLYEPFATTKRKPLPSGSGSPKTSSQSQFGIVPMQSTFVEQTCGARTRKIVNSASDLCREFSKIAA